MFFFFYDQISFSLSCTCLMGTFFLKKLDIIGFVRFSQKFFFNRQSSKFHSSNSFSSKGKGNLVTIVIGSLTAWISVTTINWQAQANFYFKRCLPEVCGKIYCSMLAYALQAFPVYANKISYLMAYTTVFLLCTSNNNKRFTKYF